MKVEINVKVVLYSAISGPLDRSKHLKAGLHGQFYLPEYVWDIGVRVGLGLGLGSGLVLWSGSGIVLVILGTLGISAPTALLHPNRSVP